MAIAGIDDLPLGWTGTSLGTLSTVIRGVSYKKPDSRNSPEKGLVPILRATNIDRTLNFNGLVYVPSSYVNDDQFLRPGDIVIAASSGSISVVGKAAQLKSEWCGSFGAFCLGIRPDDGLVAVYIGWFLQTEAYRNRVSTLAAGVNINNLRREHIEEAPLPLPPLPEQHRIVAEIEKQFTRLDASVAALKRAQANLQRYRASVLKSACEGILVPTEAELARAEGRDYEPADVLLQRILAERRACWESQEKRRDKYKEPSPPDTSELPELAEGWVWATVEQTSSIEDNAITDGPFGSNLKTSHYTVSGPRVIRLQNIGDGEFINSYAHISNEHFLALSRHEIKAGDLVIAALGETLPRACPIPSTIGSAIVKADCIKFTPHLSVALPEFLNCALNNADTRKRTASIVHGVGRPRLNLGEIKSITIPLPPLDEQRRIVFEVERFLSVIKQSEAAVEVSLKRAERLRQSILKQAFSGQLVPQDPNDEPALALLERIKAERETAREAEAAKPRARRPRAASSKRSKAAKEPQLTPPEVSS